MLDGLSVIISLKDGELHFYAPIGALCFQQLLAFVRSNIKVVICSIYHCRLSVYTYLILTPSLTIADFEAFAKLSKKKTLHDCTQDKYGWFEL